MILRIRIRNTAYDIKNVVYNLISRKCLKQPLKTFIMNKFLIFIRRILILSSILQETKIPEPSPWLDGFQSSWGCPCGTWGPRGCSSSAVPSPRARPRSAGRRAARSPSRCSRIASVASAQWVLQWQARQKIRFTSVPVLRIRIWAPVPFWPLDPGWVKSGMNNPAHISESLETIYGLKYRYLNFLMWIRDGKILEGWK